MMQKQRKIQQIPQDIQKYIRALSKTSLVGCVQVHGRRPLIKSDFTWWQLEWRRTGRLVSMEYDGRQFTMCSDSMWSSDYSLSCH